MKRLGAQSAGVFAITGVPPALLTVAKKPFELTTCPGLVFGETPMRPMSGRYDELEKLRLTWSSDFCSLYCADRNAFQPSFSRLPPPSVALACHWSPPPPRVGVP